MKPRYRTNQASLMNLFEIQEFLYKSNSNHIRYFFFFFAYVLQETIEAEECVED